MKTVAVVPIKMNNERLPGKNTKCFDNGEPLVTHILKTIKKVSNIDEIYCFCSNPAIKEFLPDGVNYLQREEWLDLSSTSITDVLTSFAENVDADVYALVHATAPFISSENIEKGVSAVLSGEYDSALSVEKMQEFLWKDGAPFNYSLDRVPRTQDLDPIYCETSGFFIYTKDLMMKEHRRVGHKPCLVEVSKIEASDIDNPIDFEIANAIYNNIIRKTK